MSISSVFDSGIRKRACPPAVRGKASGKIFVVDDEAPIVELLAAVLKTSGYSVDVSTDSTEALAMISENPQSYDLLLTDLNMPHISGVELIQELRGGGFTGKIVMHSGSLQGDEESLMKTMGVDAILHKPAAMASILSIVRMVMAQSRKC